MKPFHLRKKNCSISRFSGIIARNFVRVYIPSLYNVYNTPNKLVDHPSVYNHVNNSFINSRSTRNASRHRISIHSWVSHILKKIFLSVIYFFISHIFFKWAFFFKKFRYDLLRYCNFSSYWTVCEESAHKINFLTSFIKYCNISVSVVSLSQQVLTKSS